MSALAPYRRELPVISARLLMEMPGFADMDRVLTGLGYTLSVRARVSRQPDDTVQIRLVWRRGDHGCAVLRQVLTGALTDRVLDALGDALL